MKQNMFIDTTFKKYKIDENNIAIGELEINPVIIEKCEFSYPFIRENIRKIITKIGNRDYEKLNKYIIDSMNEYFNRLNNASASEKKRMLVTYNRLYDMWKELHNYKKNNNLVEMDKVYDLFSYELYVLGYIS